MRLLGSLRWRLLALSGAVLAATMIAAGFGLTALFSRHLERRVGQELDTHLQQLAGTLRIDAAEALSLAREPADPRFARILGGLYWQVMDETTGGRLASRSLWDAGLDLPDDAPAPGAVHVHAGGGPGGTRLLVHERRIVVPAGGRDHAVRLAVAIDRAEIEQLRAGFARDLAPALAVLGAVLLGGFALQVGAGLRPLAAMREALAAVRAGRAPRLRIDGPAEVAPLVEEVNSLLEAKEREMTRARDRAADLAHGLKTPLTALAADVRTLRARGETAIADDIDALAERMRRHVERELVRARIRHGGAGARTAVAACAEAVVRALGRTPDGARLRFETAALGDLAVAIDGDDLTELLGNLLENAARHARGLVRVVRAQEPGRAGFAVEDDGDGLSAVAMAAAANRGARLDGAGGGAGLGLAIVDDIVAANGGTLRLGPSPLGGLSAAVLLPA